MWGLFPEPRSCLNSYSIVLYCIVLYCIVLLRLNFIFLYKYIEISLLTALFWQLFRFSGKETTSNYIVCWFTIALFEVQIMSGFSALLLCWSKNIEQNSLNTWKTIYFSHCWLFNSWKLKTCYHYSNSPPHLSYLQKI